MPPLRTPDLDLANTLLSCLNGALEDHPNKPVRSCLRVGEEVAQGLSLTEDECCDGLAYVKVNQVFPSSNFPNPDEVALNCPPTEWAVDLEVGIFRCAPTGDMGQLPTCEQWDGAATTVALDAAAMRRAVACFRRELEPGAYAMVRQWLPIGPQGACTGGTMVVTVSFSC